MELEAAADPVVVGAAGLEGRAVRGEAEVHARRADELGAIAVPTVVVADRDEPDPEHPLAVGEAYASAIPGARLVVEEPGTSPIAWQGGQLSKVIADLAAST